MRNLDRGAAVDEDLQDLKLRFELLEGDRKAYYETSQWAIRRNKEEINTLRAQNKQLSEAIARIKKSESDKSGSRLTMTELEKFDQKICETQKKYDELNAECRSKENKLKMQLDELAHLKKEVEAVHSNFKDSNQAKEIRMLENRLDKAVIKFNEAQSIRKTYELIVKRLQEERLTFDNQLAHFEKTLKIKKNDCAELEMMSRDANHAKDMAKAELARFEAQVNEERKEREKDLNARKELVKSRLEASEKSDRKVAKQDDSNTEAANAVGANVELDEQAEKKMTEYQEIMRLIKEATGVSDISEVIAKFQSQKETQAQLTALQQSNTKKIEELKELKRKFQAENEEFKFNGQTKHAHSQRTIEEFQKHLEDAQALFNESKLKYERSVRILNNATAGVQHLSDKLESIKAGEETVKPILVNEKNVVESMHICVKKMETLAASLQHKELPEVPPKDVLQQQQQGEVTNILVVNPTILPTHNTRVKMKPVEFEDAEIDEDGDDDDYGEIPDRESIKKHTLQLLNSKLKTKQQKKVKRRKAALNEEE